MSEYLLSLMQVCDDCTRYGSAEILISIAMKRDARLLAMLIGGQN